MMINKIIDYLDYLFPNPKCELEYSKDYELLLAIVMSAQTTDKRVNMVNRVLFGKYDSLEKLSKAEVIFDNSEGYDRDTDIVISTRCVNP